ncbi:hypothetical protein [Chroococcidiopsis sp. TS-821]|uniref:hypothetical protein n=1 Tax=Chroococcidiopsis sp. TS-821 TaxID=1378066 RepID=UPI000CED968B|nr:hypothetical protein [Chroococcidiopsis sp. TS-821]
MSVSRRQIIKLASSFVAGAAVFGVQKRGTAIDLQSWQRKAIAKRPMQSHNKWVEKILNSDGTINWQMYTYVANNYNRRDIIDYRLGPDYNFYHSSSENIPKLWGATNDGFIGNCSTVKAGSSIGNSDWFAMSGQLIFSPDSTAPSEYQPGVMRARNGSIYLFAGASPEYCFDMRVQWTPDAGNYYNTNPDVAVQQQSWKKASGGSVPAPPIATVRTKASAGVTGFLLFTNGLIGATGTGNDGYIGCCSNPLPYPFVRLPKGKVPTSGAITPNNEFLLVTVWDTVNRKGQVAVIAIKGFVVTSNNLYLWGFPNWPTIEKMKILGYVDLPFAAPTAIQTSIDMPSNSGRGHGDNYFMDLNSQAERDTWYNWSGSFYKKTARCGYAVVISRAENRAAFIDLQPLLQYYRKMYFTTQANYDQTKNEGAAFDRWPYTFSHAPEQKPKVVSTIVVNKPTAVAAGLPWCTMYWRDRNHVFQENAYIATMDGELRIYKVGNLMTTAPAGTIGQPFKIVKIGKNPTNIDYGRGGEVGNDLFVNCRGDKTIYYLYYDGRIHARLRDARLQDPVYVAVSSNGRDKYNSPILSIMDFRGKQVVNYRYQNDVPEALRTPVGNPPGTSVFEYGYATPLPGQPFMFTSAEVI